MTGIVIPDGGTIGSTSDTDALTITNTGVVKASQSIATSTIKDATGANNSISIASDGQVTIAQNNPTITLHATGDSSSTNTTFPAGHVVQVIQSQFNPTVQQTTNSAYQDTTVFKVIQKKNTSSKILVTLSGGHAYVSQYANGVITTICQTSNTTSFTPTSTYSSSDDPTNNSEFGMEQIYNATVTNTTSHSISWLFDSSGNEFEGFRCFYKARISGRNAVFHETNTSYITLTLMEVLQ